MQLFINKRVWTDRDKADDILKKLVCVSVHVDRQMGVLLKHDVSVLHQHTTLKAGAVRRDYLRKGLLVFRMCFS